MRVIQFYLANLVAMLWLMDSVISATPVLAETVLQTPKPKHRHKAQYSNKYLHSSVTLARAMPRPTLSKNSSLDDQIHNPQKDDNDLPFTRKRRWNSRKQTNLKQYDKNQTFLDLTTPASHDLIRATTSHSVRVKGVYIDLKKAKVSRGRHITTSTPLYDTESPSVSGISTSTSLKSSEWASPVPELDHTRVYLDLLGDDGYYDFPTTEYFTHSSTAVKDDISTYSTVDSIADTTTINSDFPTKVYIDNDEDDLISTTADYLLPIKTSHRPQKQSDLTQQKFT